MELVMKEHHYFDSFLAGMVGSIFTIYLLVLHSSELFGVDILELEELEIRNLLTPIIIIVALMSFIESTKTLTTVTTFILSADKKKLIFKQTYKRSITIDFDEIVRLEHFRDFTIDTSVSKLVAVLTNSEVKIYKDKLLMIEFFREVCREFGMDLVEIEISLDGTKKTHYNKDDV